MIAAVGVAVPFTLFGYGEQRVSSILAGIWNATTPLVVLPMAVLVFRTERMTARRAVGLVLGFVGVLVVLGVWQGLGGAQLTGQLMCFGAAACYGLSIPYQKRFVAGRPESGLALSATQLLVATVQLAIVAPLVAGAPPAPTDLSLDVVGSVLALGALGTGLAFVINLRIIRMAGASTASTVTYLIPIFAALIGVLALDEHLAWYQPVGAVIVLAGVAVSQGLLVRRPKPAPASSIGRRATVRPSTDRSGTRTGPAASTRPGRHPLTTGPRRTGASRRARQPQSAGVTGGPGQQLVSRPGVDHPVGRHPAPGRPLAAETLPVELARRVRVGVDGELAARLDRHAGSVVSAGPAAPAES